MPNTIKLTPVTSSQIAAIGHDGDSTLAVQFHPRKNAEPEEQGPVYHYANVSAADFKKFSEAESQGSYFYANIKRETVKHPYTRVS